MQSNFLLKLRAFSAVFSLSLLMGSLIGCETFNKLRKPKPLVGKDVQVYDLADGKINFRMKVSGFTSTLWITTELVNNSSDENVEFSPPALLQFSEPSCLENQEFEQVDSTSLSPHERRLVRFEFKLYGKQKHSSHYERCKDAPLKFTVSGIKLGVKDIAPLSLTIQDP